MSIAVHAGGVVIIVIGLGLGSDSNSHSGFGNWVSVLGLIS